MRADEGNMVHRSRICSRGFRFLQQQASALLILRVGLQVFWISRREYATADELIAQATTTTSVVFLETKPNPVPWAEEAKSGVQCIALQFSC